MGDKQHTPDAEARAKALKPRDAATLIIVDSSSGEPRILMGQRRLDQVFLPGKYVFPGGRVDRTDKAAPVAHDLRASEREKLLIGMKGVASAARARALALAALRETFEEAGILIGAAADTSCGSGLPGWSDFLAHGLAPRLDQLTYFARAITPPGRPRRYDTRFFCCEASAIAHRVETLDGELLTLDWFNLDQARGLDLPSITRAIVEDLADALARDALRGGAVPVPFYHYKNGTFHRDLLG